ncbi:hypothetical protein VP01_507g5 [Puccinia sorghi]|uniref:Uncharacterized protein n=1 Tax=Puccinia sorghi TaxID=27349 RepID=A0A0L6ULF0_9BASI|nr:hypothetical protein VP01_507g5 [Puccinia sorghi]
MSQRGVTALSSNRTSIKARENDQWNIEVVMFIEIIQMLHTRGPEPPIGMNAIPGPPIVHVFGIPFKSFFQTKICEILTTRNVDSYTTSVDNHGQSEAHH